MHFHSMWSGDCTTTPEEIERAVVASGIDVVCITDHNAVNGAFELAAELSCRVVVGEELRTGRGEIIGLFLRERIPLGLSPVEAARRIRDQGGVVYIPHPFDPMRANLHRESLSELTELGLVDAVEVLNAKTSLQALNADARAHAERFGLGMGAGSDGHVAEALGAALVEMPDFDSADEFKANLHSGRVVGHHWDQPRPWCPRIVPSTKAV
ncbi:MAG: hypothetical protein JJLCMIEE_02152 [Acidimicrobiales bacterium]|nr:hypothetical protein [Acidimicrobiales bacterium]